MIEHIGNLEVEDESMTVVYDPQTGQIVHMHYSVTTKGGTHPAREILEKDALEQLAQAQPKMTKKMALLHVKPSGFKPRTFYKIDIKKQILVEIQPPKPSTILCHSRWERP